MSMVLGSGAMMTLESATMSHKNNENNPGFICCVLGPIESHLSTSISCFQGFQKWEVTR